MVAVKAHAEELALMAAKTPAKEDVKVVVVMDVQA